MKNVLRMVTAALSAVCFASTLASAQTWPQKPIKMIIPFPAGGGTDLIGRLMAKHLSERLGQQVYVENRGGANGGIGLQALAQSEPDGYTIAAASDTPLVVNPSLYEKLPYQPLRDFQAVAGMVKFPGMVAVHPSVPVKTIAELIALAKAKPGSLAYSSGGIGNFGHLAAELFNLAADVKMLHVPYRGVGPATQAIIAGDVQLTFSNIVTTMPHVTSGKLVALAVNEPKRIPAFPNLPAVAETVPGFEMAPWVGIIVPAKTPKPIVERLSREVRAVMNDPAVVKILSEQQIAINALDTGELAELIKKDLEKWAVVIKKAGIKVQ
ncbi:MAG: tripartite tricarboxylate transporter substrate binding protein [Rhizobiales bacterium]|nr:tripartite tricarboxylate transporter substrate binding protein [Hyphomicrobiales bacterium]